MKQATCTVCGTNVPQKPGRGRPKLTHDECRKGIHVSHGYPETSKEMAEQATTTKLTWAILSLLEKARLSDDDMERMLGRAHQSVSAVRRGLVKRGLVQWSGEFGVTRYGNRARLWERVPR